jgi:hypothetical protein
MIIDLSHEVQTELGAMGNRGQPESTRASVNALLKSPRCIRDVVSGAEEEKTVGK